MLSIILPRLLLFLGVAGLIFSAWLSWENDNVKLEIAAENGEALINRLNSQDFPLFATEPIRYFLQRTLLNPSFDNNDLLALVRLYLSRRPLDANVWVYGSQFHQRSGDLEKSAKYLAVAYRLSETNRPILLKVFNRYLELGLIDEAMPVAHDIVSAKPHEFRRLFYLMARLSDDYARVVDEIIPEVVPLKEHLKRPLEQNFYYQVSLFDAIKLKNLPLAIAIWEAMPLKFKRHSNLGLRYIDYLVGLQERERVESAWFDMLGHEMLVGEIPSDAGNVMSPCWNVRAVNGAESNVSISDADSNVIELMFMGELNLNYSHTSCVVAIDQNTKYELTGRSKGEGISTLSGPFVDVFFPGTKFRGSRSDALIGNWGWTNFSLTFETPENVNFAKIRLRRQHTALLDSKISGVVWFSDFKLEKKAATVDGATDLTADE